MKPIVANALAQFAMNIDIMPRLLMLLIAPNERIVRDIWDFLNSEPGHPQKRIRRVQMELGEPSSTLRNIRCEQIYERLKECANLVESNFAGLLQGRNYHMSEASIEARILINDELNQTFLHYFVDITGLPASVYHARDAGIQWDALAEIFERKTGIKLCRDDMTAEIGRRASFKPKVRTLLI